MGYISLVHYVILINGTSKGFFHAKRGLKKGDPLSPFLFTLVADNLSCLIKRAEEWGLVKDFKVGNNNVLASHLQFVDDTIIFCDAHCSYINNIRILLKCFERISRLRINMEKSKVVGLNLAVEELNEYALLLGCQKKS